VGSQPDGPTKEYYENGKLKSEGNFSKGLPHGIQTEYFENGDVKSKIRYENGREIERIVNNRP
jgi:antitoxin component YwqK of YwqJK toxin-antitoxin module